MPMGAAAGGAPPPLVRDLVLLGGGHSHVEVLRSFGMRPMAGVRLTLVTRGVYTPYSGMLPGYVAGKYSYDDCHIDVARLAAFAGARLVVAEAVGLDLQRRRVLLGNSGGGDGSGAVARPPIAYDVLSIDIGIAPGAAGVPGALEHATPVKPIERFVARFEALLARGRRRQRQQQRDEGSSVGSGGSSVGGGAGGGAPGEPVRVAVVGGGAGGVELALALQERLAAEAGGAAAVEVR